jgi:hypothetical protein
MNYLKEILSVLGRMIVGCAVVIVIGLVALIVLGTIITYQTQAVWIIIGACFVVLCYEIGAHILD